MKKIVKYEFTEQELELLKKQLPQNPCIKCELNGVPGCCGCQEAIIYENSIKIYKDLGIFDIAREIQMARDYLNKMEELRKELQLLDTKVMEIQTKYPEIFY